MDFTLRVWRQAGPGSPGRFVEYPAPDISPDASFLEMLDVLNEDLSVKGEPPVAFENDCREGIVGNHSGPSRSASRAGRLFGADGSAW